MSAYGYEIVQTLIVDIVPDEHVKKAMNEINAGMFPTVLCSCFNLSYSYFLFKHANKINARI